MNPNNENQDGQQFDPFPHDPNNQQAPMGTPPVANVPVNPSLSPLPQTPPQPLQPPQQPYNPEQVISGMSAAQQQSSDMGQTLFPQTTRPINVSEVDPDVQRLGAYGSAVNQDAGQYLEQITPAAPPPPPATPIQKVLSLVTSNKKISIGVGALIVVLIIVGVVSNYINSITPQYVIDGANVGNNLSVLRTLISYDGVGSLDSNTQKIVAEIKLTELSQTFAFTGIVTLANPEVPPPDNAGIITQLNNARASGNLIQVYREKLGTELSAIKTSLSNLHESISNDAGRSIVQQAQTDFTELERRFRAN